MILFTTARICVRRIEVRDALALAAWRSDTFVARYVPWTPPCTVDQATTLIERVRRIDPASPGDDGVVLAVDLRTDRTDDPDHAGEPIGEAMIRHDAGDARQCVIGYALDRRHHGRGLATELTLGLIDHCFGQSETHRVTAWCDARNAASIRVLEKAGMRLEATFVQGVWTKGEWVDEQVHAMLRSEWRPAHA